MAGAERRGNSVRIKVSCGYDTNGEQIIEQKTFKLNEQLTEKQRNKEIERLKCLFEEQVKSNQYLDGTMRFAKFTDLWREDYAKTHLKTKTFYEYNKLLPIIISEIGNIKLCDLKPTHINRMYRNISERGNVKIEKRIIQLNEKINDLTIQGQRAKTIEKLKKELTEIKPRPVSPNTVRAYHLLLSSMLEKAVEWEVIPSNPAKKASPPKRRNIEAKYLEENDVRNLLKLLDKESIQFKTMTAMYLFSGVRRGELLGLWWDDIDFDMQTIRIRRNIGTISGKGIYEDTPKTDSSKRTIKLPSLAFDYLRVYKEWQDQQKYFASDLWEESNKIFTNDHGGYLHPDTITKRFAEFIKKNDLPHVTIHSLRHTYANIMIYSGIELKTISHRLGHANSTTTQNIYSHVFQSADEKAADTLDNYFRNDIDN